MKPDLGIFPLAAIDLAKSPRQVLKHDDFAITRKKM